MLGQILRKFLNFIKPQKKLWYGVFIFLIIGGLALPFLPAKAIFGEIVGAIYFLPTLIIINVLQFVVIALSYLMALANWMLSWAINNPFNVPFTTPGVAPAGNPIIAIGWTLLRDIVNMLFILAMAYIGLATSLGLAGFNTKKVFLTLLIVALFVNFTPLICGVIVDAGNIVATFFVQGVNFNTVTESYDSLRANIPNASFGLVENQIAVTTMLSLIIYGAIMVAILLAFAVIFLMRAPIIWMLVILSPLAFFFRIIPQTETYFKKWWSFFIRWAFITVPAGFFLYLSQQVMVQGADLIRSGADDPTGGAFATLSAPLVATFFLIFGLWLTLKMSGAAAMVATGALTAMGLSGVVGLTQGKGIETIKGLAKKYGPTALSIPYREGRGLASGIKGAYKGIKKGEGFSGALKGFGREASSGATVGATSDLERAKKLGFRTLERAHLVRPGFYEEQQKKRWDTGEQQKKFESLPTERLEEIAGRISLRPEDVKSKVAALQVLAKKGKLKDENKNKYTSIISQAKTMGADMSQITKARPDWITDEDVDKKIKEIKEKEGVEPERENTRRLVIRELIEKMTPRQFRENVQRESLENVDVFLGMDAAKMSDLMASGERNKVNTIRDFVRPGSELKRKLEKRAEAVRGNEREETRIEELIQAVKNSTASRRQTAKTKEEEEEGPKQGPPDTYRENV